MLHIFLQCTHFPTQKYSGSPLFCKLSPSCKKCRILKFDSNQPFPPDFSTFSDVSSNFQLHTIAFYCLLPCTSQACILFNYDLQANCCPPPCLVQGQPSSSLRYLLFHSSLVGPGADVHPQHLHSAPPSSTSGSEVGEN